MRPLRPLEAAAHLVAGAVTARQHGADQRLLAERVHRVFERMTSRGDRQRMVGHLALMVVTMATHVPEGKRQQLLDELIAIGRLSPADRAFLIELSKFEMVA